MVSLAARGGMIASMSEPRIDLHGHAGRCFLAGLPAGHQLVATMGAAAVGDAVRAAQAAGMTAVNLSAVSDFAVLRSDPGKGLRAHRDFRPGEAYADYRRQLDGIRAGAAEAGAQVATSADDLERAARDGRTAVLLGCEGGDFLEGDLGRLAEARAAGVTLLTLVHYRVNELGDVQTEAPVHGGLSRFGRDVVAECNRLGIVIDCAHATFGTTMAVLEDSSQPVIISHGQLGHADAGHADAGHPDADHPRLMTADHAAAVAEAGGLIGAWPCGFTSRSFADFGTEILRLTEAAGPDRVAIGTDLDGNYRPVLTSYDQLADLAGLLRDRGLPAADVGQILGGNAMNLLTRILLHGNTRRDRGTDSAASTASRSSSRVVRPVRGSTRTWPRRPCRIIEPGPSRRVPRTGTRRRTPGRSAPASTAAWATNMTESSAGVAPHAPNCGPSTSGSAMSIAAFGSPVAPQAGTPAFSTSVGLAPNQAGSHSTMSASLPTSTEPTSCASPCATAGLRVSLARYRSTRSLSSGPAEGPAEGPAGSSAERPLHHRGQAERAAHRLPGPAHALRIGGGDRDDAEVVQRPLGRHRAGPDPVPGQRRVPLRVQAVHQRDHVQVLGHRVPAERQRGVGRGGDDVGPAGQFQHVRRVPAAAALDVEGVEHPAAGHRERVGHAAGLVQPVGVQGHLHVVLVGHGQRGVQAARVRAQVLVHLEAARAARGQALHQRRRVRG